jgi:phthiocerol/phenolphthiocerol synthesis type-I polyketide synthase A
LKVIATRSRLMARQSGQGAVALLELDAEAAETLIADYPGVGLAGYVSPRQTVIAGPVAAVDAVMAEVSAQDRFARRVNMDVASHTSLMDPILPELRAALADIRPEPPTIPFFSTVVEGVTSPRLDAEYWVDNVRQPARLSQAVTAAGQHHATFVEISAHPMVVHAISETLGTAHHRSIGTLSRDGDDTIGFHSSLNSVHTSQSSPTHHPPEPHPVLPSSPWHHTSHWITTDDHTGSTGSRARPGTLLGQHVAVATTPPAHLWQARLALEATPYPGRYRVRGADLVPDSVLLHTLSAAAAEVDASTLADVRFEKPIVLDQLRIVQVLVDNDYATISSSAAADAPAHRWVRHVTARLSRQPRGSGASDDHDGREKPRNGGLSVDSVTSLQQAWGIDGQPFEWLLRSCRSAPGMLHGDVELTETSTVALLDAAVQLGRLVDASDSRLMVPTRVDSVCFAADPFEGGGSVEVYQRGGDDDELVVDIAVKAPGGRVCVDIRGLRYGAVEAGQAPATAADGAVNLAHALEWTPWQQVDAGERRVGVAEPVAVIGQIESARVLCDRLAEAGYVSADVTEARSVVYIADAESAHAGDADIDCAVRLSAEVANLVRRLANRDDDDPATLWIVTRGVREGASDAAVRQSGLWGMAGVIRAEQPQLWGGLVDLPAGRTAAEDIAEHASVLAELLSTPAKSVLAVRDGELVAPGLVPVGGDPVRAPLRCRSDAAYLVTGGLGALGLLMAGWLADRGARRLVLAGRTSLPPRREWDGDNDPETRAKIAAIRALEVRGVTVEAVAVDVGSREAMDALLVRRDNDGAPPIRGVIHAAGVTDAQLLTEVSEDRLRRTLWPKVAGAQVLHEAFPPGTLDFLFLTASAGTVFGVPGQGAYASANAYLDGLARARREQGCHTVSLDWVAWQGLGFATEADVVLQELERVGSRALVPEEAFAAWERVARYDVAQAVIAPLASSDPSAADAADGDGTSPATAWAQLPAEQVHSELENGLRTILARELQMPEAEFAVDRPFAELGLNSVMAMSVRRQTEQLVGLELSVTMLWNHPTVASLAAYLVKKLVPEENQGDIEALSEDDSSVLDELFDIVESAPAGSESGI